MLLRKMNAHEIIIEICKFKDFSLGCSLIEDCFENSKFEEKDWHLTRKYLEAINSAIKFRMCYLIISKRPILRLHAINYIRRSINRDTWRVTC